MFKLIRKTPMPAYDGTGLFFKHDKTGMEVFCIENNSEELTCAFTFATPSEDSTGLAHILEHTVLCGSGDYPVKDPFTEIYNSSPNTFLNAMTFCDKTMYPFSSPLKKDFDIIFDIYADAVFNPLLRRQSFEQEGVRFYNGRVDGVVFNEMRGALSSEDSIVGTYSANKLYRGTAYEYDSGGNPTDIAKLTYDRYLERYGKWYSPSNCRMFLYGNLKAEEYLGKIEKKYLCGNTEKRWTGKKIINSSDGFEKKRYRPLRDVRYCSAGNANSVVLTWLTGRGDSPFDNLVLSVLTDILLGDAGAPLYRAITESDLGIDLNAMSGMDSEFPVIPFTVGFVNAKKNKEDEIEKFLIDTLRKIAENGLDENAVKAALKRQAFALREIQGSGYPYGITLAIRTARYWLRGTKPELALDNEALLKKLEKQVSKGRFFEKWILENLVNNKRRCLLTVKTDKQYEKKLQKQLDCLYEKAVSRTDAKTYAENQAEFERFIKTEDDRDVLDKIPKICVKDIPEKIPGFDMEDRKVSDVPVKTMKLFTRGICYFNLAFDVTSLTEEEKKLLPLLVRFLQMCGTEKHNYTELGTLLKLRTGGFDIIISASSRMDGKPLSLMLVRTRTLEEDFENALELFSEIFFKCDLSDYRRIKAALTDAVLDYESSYLESANTFATVNACASLSAVCRETELTSGTSSYLYLSGLLKKFGSEKKTIRENLVNLRNKIFNSKRLTVQIGCEEKFLDIALRNSESFLKAFPGETLSGNLNFYSDFKGRTVKTLVKVSGGPSYNSLAFKLNCKNEKSLVSAILFASILSGRYLFETVRGKNGAYGAECHVDIQEKIFSMSSYRDPEIEKTYSIFRDVFSYDVSEEDLESTVVTILGKELKPLVPKRLCLEAFRRSLLGITDAIYMKRRKTMLSVTVKDIKKIASDLKKDIGKGSMTSVSAKGEDVFKNGEVVNLGL